MIENKNYIINYEESYPLCGVHEDPKRYSERLKEYLTGKIPTSKITRILREKINAFENGKKN